MEIIPRTASKRIRKEEIIPFFRLKKVPNPTADQILAFCKDKDVQLVPDAKSYLTYEDGGLNEEKAGSLLACLSDLLKRDMEDVYEDIMEMPQ